MTGPAKSASVSVTELEFDVAGSVACDGPCLVGATLFVPATLPPRPGVVVALPGASFNRCYWDIRPPGRDGYSQARYFAERGVVFVAVDYLGGEAASRTASGESPTLTVVAAAAHEVLLRIREGLREGAFRQPAVDGCFIGLGQSFGGSVLILQQALHHDYEAVAIAGTSSVSLDNVPLELPADWATLSEESRRQAVQRSISTLLGVPLSAYHEVPREPVHDIFFGPEGIAEDLLEYEEKHVRTLVPRDAAVDTSTPGFVARYAAMLDCPVFVGFGEHDVVRRPHIEPSAYEQSRDVTLVVIPRMAHMHNFFDERRALWDRMLSWVDWIASGRGRSGGT